MSATVIEPLAPQRLLGGAFRKARAIMQRPAENKPDPLTRLRELIAARQEIQRRWQALLEYCKNIFVEHQRAVRKFNDDHSIENLNTAIETLDKWEAAQKLVHSINVEFGNGAAVDREFRKENPNYREALVAAATFHLTNARREHDEILKAETARLSAKNFDLGEIAASPECKRASAKVGRYQTLLRGIETSSSESVWQTYAAQLLNE